MNKEISILIQVIILVGATISFSYIAGESYNNQNKVQIVSKLGLSAGLSIIGKILFGFIPSVSAASLSAEDLEVYYCPKTKDSKSCMEFIKAECTSKCEVECVPTKGINECTRGTCYNSNNGMCSVNSPKGICESQGLEWHNNPSGNIPQCMKGCCIINGKADFTTEQECSYRAEKSGNKKDFRSEIQGQPACEALNELKEEGACVFEKQPLNQCIFTTKENCQARKGKFYSRVLCSNPSLNSECRPQVRVACAEDKEEVYWFDSCGNRENIYDFSKKAELKENGLLVSKQESCALPSSKEPGFAEKQKTCGNCNSLLGAVCGKKTSKEKLVDSELEYVCRDQSCIDENGQKRAHGESWCRYRGAVGEDKNRGADTPGSNHFLVRCENGEIVVNACGNYRESVCAEARVQTSSGGSFSNAQCVTNLGMLCLEYNKLEGDEKTKQCQKNPHCFIKSVSVASKFSFDFCAPKYKLGLDRDNSDYNEAQCGMINPLKCQYIKVKKLFGKKEINRECLTERFTQQMNDLCVSIGDCGAQANYQGDFTENYLVSNAPRLGSSYLSEIMRYHEESLFKNKLPQTLDVEDYYKIVGIPADLGNAEIEKDSTASMLKMGGMISGATGSLALMGANYLAGIAATAPAIGPLTATQSLSAALVPYAQALAGAAIGFAVTAFLIDITGIGRGLPPAVTYVLLAAGAYAGAAMVMSAFSNVGFLAGACGATGAGCIVAVVVIIIIVVLYLFGIGKIKKKDVTFTCKPWTPPTGGKNCGKCGKDGFPCTKYACESLGMTCELINEDIGSPECVDIAPDDVTPPVLKAESIEPKDYKYSEEEFGVKVEGQTECIEETYTPIFLKFKASEPARCKIAGDLQESWEEMEYLGGRSGYLRNHTAIINVPSLESLGLPGFDPKAKADIRINIFCEDKSGNKNTRAYTLNFCVKQGKDSSPARIIDRDPALNEIAITTREVNASVYTNEPAECNWDLNDKSYELMANEMECANEIEDYQVIFGSDGKIKMGFKCDSLLQTPKDENLFYIRCKDQPWYAEKNESLRNVMSESYVLNLTKIKEPLKVEVLSPIAGKLVEAESEPVSVELKVRTSGGLNGQAECFYQYKDSTIRFAETFSIQHSNKFDYLLEGNIEIPVICKDIIGNVAETKALFKIKLDTTPPKVTRVYDRSGTLHVITEKYGRCTYSTDIGKACTFNYEGGTEMSGEKLVHTLTLQKEQAYYIKCKNKFNKVSGSCSIIVKGGKI